MGKIQNEDIKSLAELTAAGGLKSQLPNDSKIYVNTFGSDKLLSEALSQRLLSPRPLWIHANTQGADANLYIESNKALSLEGVSLLSAPLEDAFKHFTGASINFQTKGTSGGTVNIVWPETEQGAFYRAVFTYMPDNVIDVAFSNAAESVNLLDNPGVLFDPNGLPVGYVDLQAISTEGTFKGASSAENVISNQDIYAISAGSSGQVISGGGGGSGTSNGLQMLEMKSTMEKQGIYSPITDVEDTGLNESLTNTDQFTFNLARPYTTADGTSIYLDVNQSLLDSMTAVTGWAAQSGTMAINAQAAYDNMGVRQTLAAATTGGSGIHKAFTSFSMTGRYLRVAVLLEHKTNLNFLRVVLETTANNNAYYEFPAAGLQAGINYLEVDGDAAPTTTAGTYNRNAITRVYLQMATNSAVSITATWMYLRTSLKNALPTSLPQLMPIHDNVNQQLMQLLGTGNSSGQFTIAQALATNFSLLNTVAKRMDLYMADKTGTIPAAYQGAAQKRAWHITSKTLPAPINATRLNFSCKGSVQYTTVTGVPSTTTLQVSSTGADNSAWFPVNSYVWLFRLRRESESRYSNGYEAALGSNAVRLKVTATTTFATGVMTITHDQTNQGAANDGTWFVVPEAFEFWHHVGGPNEALEKLDPDKLTILPGTLAPQRILLETFDSYANTYINSGGWTTVALQQINSAGPQAANGRLCYPNFRSGHASMLWRQPSENYSVAGSDEIIVNFPWYYNTPEPNTIYYANALFYIGAEYQWSGTTSTPNSHITNGIGFSIAFGTQLAEGNYTAPNFVLRVMNGQQLVGRMNYSQAAGLANSTNWQISYQKNRVRVMWWSPAQTKPTDYQWTVNYPFTNTGSRFCLNGTSWTETALGNFDYNWPDLEIRRNGGIMYSLSGQTDLSVLQASRLTSASALVRGDASLNPVLYQRDTFIE